MEWTTLNMVSAFLVGLHFTFIVIKWETTPVINWMGLLAASMGIVLS